MKVKGSDWLANYIVKKGITHNFTVPGGGAMHLNMSFGHTDGLKSIFVQHEQAAAIAAEGYYRAANRIPVVCCTTGPGGTNTLTGVLGAWLDSIPMLVISGQVRYATTARAAQIPVRAMGDQEYDITPTVSHMSKYAEMVTDIKLLKYHVDKALFLMENGRPGPVWIDIPLDIQGGYIEEEEFVEFDPKEEGIVECRTIEDEKINTLIQKLGAAKRPVFYVGNGIHIADCVGLMREVAEKLKIPVVTAFDATDLMPFDHELFCGNPGLIGDRAGNWTVQNADFILTVGCRLGCRQVGYNVKSWAREAYVAMVDIDKYELETPSIHVELPIWADAKEFLEVFNQQICKMDIDNCEWLSTCKKWRNDYPVVIQKHHEQKEYVNAYHLLELIGKLAEDNSTIVLGNGTAMGALPAIYIKEHTRLISNSGAASMGYDLPAAIGACFARNKAPIICVTGDGSIQMNIQELQTIVFHKLPIKIFCINNGGYHSMRQTENNLFPELSPVGIGPETGDLSFPEMSKIVSAYGMVYKSVSKNNEAEDAIKEVLAKQGPMFCEFFVDTNQAFEPKSATKKLNDGRLLSPPLEDLAPFLPREELEKIMIIPMWQDK